MPNIKSSKKDVISSKIISDKTKENNKEDLNETIMLNNALLG